MVTRYFLRTRVLQGIYGYVICEKSKRNEKEAFSKESIDTAERIFSESLDDLKKLYILILLFLIKIKKASKERVEYLRSRKISNIPDSLVMFSENKVLEIIESNKELIFFLGKYKIVKFWEKETVLIDSIINKIEKLEINEINTNDISLSAKILGNIYVDIISNNKDINEILGRNELYWITDMWAINGLVLKTINRVDFLLKENKLLSVYKDIYDKSFACKVFLEVLSNREDLDREISELSKNWDNERISEIDLILIKMGISENKLFKHEIPLRVILNEYIEISKEFSSEKSYTFVNGILNNHFKKI